MTGPGVSPGGYDPAGDEPYVGSARVRPYLGSSFSDGDEDPATDPTWPPRDDGHGREDRANGRVYPLEITSSPAPLPRRSGAAVGRVELGAIRADRNGEPSSALAPTQLTADDEGTTYVEGRPGQQLAEDLAEQRRRELPSTKQAEKAEDAKRRVMPLWQELPLLLVVSFCVAVLVRSFLVQAFVIPSSSMEETLLIGDRVLVSKIVYDTRDPRRGEVIVFRGTDRWAPENLDPAPDGFADRIGDTLGDLVGVSRPGEKDFIKRIIGLPGDRVFCCDGSGRVTVNGFGLDEPYLSSNNPLEIAPIPGLCGARQFGPVTVPPGQLFVMGDNRAVSQDSRCQGTIPIENVVGRAFFRVWPPSHWGGIDTPDTFARVPPPS